MAKHTLVFHLLGVSKKLQRAIGLKSQSLSLSYSEARALLVISSQNEISQKEIAYKLQLEPASIVTLIDELEKQKLVRRQILTDNRRMHNINLSEKGKKYVAIIKKHTYDLEKYIIANLKTHEATNLQKSIEHLDQILNAWHQNHQNHTTRTRKEVKQK